MGKSWSKRCPVFSNCFASICDTATCDPGHIQSAHHILISKLGTAMCIIFIKLCTYAVAVSNAKFTSSIFQGIIQSNSYNNITKSNPRQTVISFVNGIYHTVSDCQLIKNRLEQIFAEEVRAFYNPSTGNWISDASRAGFELVRRPDDLNIAQALALHLRQALKDVGSDGRVLHIAHSGGAIITYLAAKHHLTPEETARIDVVTFGGGRSITRKYFPGRLINYYSRNDPLLFVDHRAAWLSKISNNNNYNNTNTNNSYNEVKDPKHNTSFIFLDALSGNPIIDHSMEGPTYQWGLEIEAQEYRKRIKEYSTFFAIQKFHIRLARKSIAQFTGLHHFWDDIPSFSSMIRITRKKSASITNLHRFFSRNIFLKQDIISSEYNNNLTISTATTSTSNISKAITTTSTSTSNIMNTSIVINSSSIMSTSLQVEHADKSNYKSNISSNTKTTMTMMKTNEVINKIQQSRSMQQDKDRNNSIQIALSNTSSSTTSPMSSKMDSTSSAS
eukprot:gene1992-3874_t